MKIQKRSLSILLTAVLLVACSPKQDDAPVTHTDFKGKDIAVITGVLTVNTAKEIGANPVEYGDSETAAEDVRNGRVAGYMHALTLVQAMASQTDEFEVIPIPKDIFAAEVAGFSLDQAVVERFNAFFAAAEADGTIADMSGRWFGEGMDLPIPEIPNSGENGNITVATCSDSSPYVFKGADGELAGFSAELALRFGAYEGKTVTFIDMPFGELITYIADGKADIGLANMAITEERKESVLFTDPIFDEGHGILIMKQEGK